MRPRQTDDAPCLNAFLWDSSKNLSNSLIKRCGGGVIFHVILYKIKI